MHILYMHQHFTTRRGYTGNRSYEFSKFLMERGHKITMICSGIDNEPRLTLEAGEQYREVEIEGIHCVPIRAANANPLAITGQSGYRRMLGFLNFVRVAKSVGRKLPKPDIVFSTHTPLTIGLAGLNLARHFDVPHVFEVRDLWPQALINLGVLKNPLVIAWMRHLERKIYSASEHVVALSPGMKEGVVASGVIDADDVSMIPNASDIGLFDPAIDRSFGRERLGLGERVAAIYFGGMGHANNLEYAIEAAQILESRGRDDIVVVLHGGGGRKAAHEQQVSELGLKNVIFSDPVPDKEVVAKIVAGCDICMTIYRASKEHTWSPNKMFDALAAGRPVLINVPGWLGETIDSNGCGYSVDSESPEALANALEKLADDPDLRAEMGRNSRRLAESEFSREKLADKLDVVFQNAIDNYSGSTAV